MIRPRIRRQRSFVLEVQAEEAAALAIENQELIEATFSEVRTSLLAPESVSFAYSML
eukprot:SAG31_NODE_920_length_10987_cov_4.682757_8_plen_57_part_00